jgi:hypothetical protein
MRVDKFRKNDVSFVFIFRLGNIWMCSNASCNMMLCVPCYKRDHGAIRGDRCAVCSGSSLSCLFFAFFPPLLFAFSCTCFPLISALTYFFFNIMCRCLAVVSWELLKSFSLVCFSVHT